ncbi:MAG: hypothetical protein IIZ47_02435 [Erysipelotrichaceae bacterium]|nr:hypothetical protein [Erysipelotrichaceae bacterium]
MKRLFVILLLGLILCGCAGVEKPVEAPEEKPLSIAVPAGAPALAFYTQTGNELFATGDVKSILPELKSDKGSDIIVIDTVNGIRALNDGAPYKLAATITFGNFYLAATGHDEDQTMDPGDYVVVFSKGATPDLVFHYIYGDAYDENLHYVNAVADATPCLVKGINISDDSHSTDDEPYVDYVFIAEPALTASMKQNPEISVYADIQEEYRKKSGQGMIQASVFVSDRLSDEEADAYLNTLEEDIRALLDNPDLFVEKTSEFSDEEVKEVLGLPNSAMAAAVIRKNNAIGLGFLRAYENREAIDAFISIFGLEKTDEGIYLK